MPANLGLSYSGVLVAPQMVQMRQQQAAQKVRMATVGVYIKESEGGSAPRVAPRSGAQRAEEARERERKAMGLRQQVVELEQQYKAAWERKTG